MNYLIYVSHQNYFSEATYPQNCSPHIDRYKVNMNAVIYVRENVTKLDIKTMIHCKALYPIYWHQLEITVICVTNVCNWVITQSQPWTIANFHLYDTHLGGGTAASGCISYNGWSQKHLQCILSTQTGNRIVRRAILLIQVG
jgi:hypothetical protein